MRALAPDRSSAHFALACCKDMNEFELIRRYFDRRAGDALLGIGDDCALLSQRDGFELAVSTDMLVSGRHFFPDAEPEALGWKALAVNLSDLAAMGAAPRAFTLALALPEANEAWLGAFSRGLFDCADRHRCELIGGDTTRGPLNICVTVLGEAPRGAAIRRSGARAGDEVWVSGVLGDAALALRAMRAQKRSEHESSRAAGTTSGARASLVRSLERPVPRIALGIALRGVASAMIDLSDGLAGDLAHVLAASKVGATIAPDRLPLSNVLAAEARTLQLECALGGGDDYELCFTAPASAREAVRRAGTQAAVQLTRIGIIDGHEGLRCTHPDGSPFRFPDGVAIGSFDHFA